MRLGRSSEHGLRLIIARATAGDAIWFKATIAASQTSPPAEVIRTPWRCVGPKPSASSPNPPKPYSCSASIRTTTGTDPPNPPTLTSN